MVCLDYSRTVYFQIHSNELTSCSFPSDEHKTTRLNGCTVPSCLCSGRAGGRVNHPVGACVTPAVLRAMFLTSHKLLRWEGQSMHLSTVAEADQKETPRLCRTMAWGGGHPGCALDVRCKTAGRCSARKTVAAASKIKTYWKKPGTII